MLYSHNIYFKRLSKPTISVVNLEDIKLFLDIKTNAHDKLLSNLLDMATEYAEWYMERSLRKQEWQILVKGYLPKEISLRFGPVNNIQAITVSIANDSEKDLPQEKYYLEKLGDYVKFTDLIGRGQLKITYSSGYEDPEEIPSPVKEGIMHHIASVYNDRDSSKFIGSVRHIYSIYRNFKIAL